MLTVLTKVVLCCFLIYSVLGKEEVPSHHHEKHTDGGAHNKEYDHESVLGSRAKNEEFSMKSADEAKAELSEMIGEMDVNKDGAVSKEELKAWLARQYLSLGVEDALKDFELSDTDTDGMVSWDEYIRGRYELDADALADAGEDENPEMFQFAEMAEEDKGKFAAADVNGDKLLDMSEYPAFMSPWDYEHMHELILTQALASWDLNGDGKIDLKEFLADVTEQETILEETEEFKAHDVDGNGILDREEIRPWVMPDSEEETNEEAEHLWENTDVDKDGILTPEEILDQHDLWVGSMEEFHDKYSMTHDPSEL